MRRLYSILLLLFIVWFAAGSEASALAEKAGSKEQVKAAFVRDGQLWLKVGDEEKQLSSYAAASGPVWSYDGQWIAYTAGTTNHQLRIHHLENGRDELVSEGTSTYRWANHESVLAYKQTPPHVEAAVVLEPPYAKWGRLAMEEVSKKYRGNIVDYQHLGRVDLPDGEAEESFKLWLKEAGREFGVLVKIRFDRKSEKVRSIQLIETNR
jgi:hypothetical protein